MAHYFSYRFSGTGVLLNHSNGSEWFRTVFDAEQHLLASISRWSSENKEYARQEMEILTSILRSA